MYVILTYWTVAVTPRIGINLRIMALLAAILPLVLYPVIVAVGSILFGIGFSLVYTFDLDVWCRCNDMWRKIPELCVDFWCVCCRPHSQRCGNYVGPFFCCCCRCYRRRRLCRLCRRRCISSPLLPSRVRVITRN